MPLKFRHAGQACITANRIYVQRGVYEKFSTLITERTSKLKVGHGMEKDTTMGPLTVPASLDKVASQLEDATSQGAKVLTGGKKITKDGGYFFEPTIINDVTASMKVASEETFGPMLAIIPFDSEEEAVSNANNTSMGLASYFFTKNVDRTWRLLENLEAGMIGMNTGKYPFDFTRTGIDCTLKGNASAAESPFGGIKESGFGKESGKDVAINEYLITKTGTMTIEGQY